MFRLKLGVFLCQTEARGVSMFRLKPRSVSMFRLKLGVFLCSD